MKQCIAPKAGFVVAEGLQGPGNDLTSRWQVRQLGSYWAPGQQVKPQIFLCPDPVSGRAQSSSLYLVNLAKTHLLS